MVVIGIVVIVMVVIVIAMLPSSFALSDLGLIADLFEKCS